MQGVYVNFCIVFYFILVIDVDCCWYRYVWLLEDGEWQLMLVILCLN